MAMVVKNNMSALNTLNTLNKNTNALKKSLETLPFTDTRNLNKTMLPALKSRHFYRARGPSRNEKPLVRVMRSRCTQSRAPVIYSISIK